MKNEFYYPSKDGVTEIHAIEWIPEGNIKGILQICHGMCEFIDRYDDFANYLNQNGYYVTGNDHLGHGKSVQDKDHYGYFHDPDGNKCVISDIHSLRERTQKKYPDVPYFLLGHSMGSFLARQYICLHGERLAGAIIMGTGSQPDNTLKLGMRLCRMISKFHGQMHRSKFIDNMAFGSYNKKFEPARTPNDWLTKDSQIVDTYLTNPLCTFMFTVNAYYHLFCTIQFDQQESNIQKIPKTLPILVTSGADDPVGDFGKGVQQAYDAYKKAGIKDLQIKLYENDRHEILNETDRETVYADMLAWLESKRI